MITALMVTLKNGIIDLTNKLIGVRQLFLQWALRAQWIDHSIGEQKKYKFNDSIHVHTGLVLLL